MAKIYQFTGKYKKSNNFTDMFKNNKDDIMIQKKGQIVMNALFGRPMGKLTERRSNETNISNNLHNEQR